MMIRLYNLSRRGARAVSLLGVVLFLAVSLSACSQSLPAVTIAVGSNKLDVELATTPAERERGLMFRTQMAENHGMLFIFPNDQELAFWMKNTRIPLSIAFISSDGYIKSVADMQPESLDSIYSDYSVRYALEVNQGYFARHGVKVGEKVELPADLPKALK
ncbi:MAG TPA: DUF192 domain-containing protein [Spirochaetia bacterium]|nr:DUF192 domain-containing protein [Spirochaetia bacterium]